MKRIGYILVLILLFINCKNSNKKIITFEYSNVDLKKTYEAFIEIPAGTNKKFEYNYLKKTIECEIINGKERIVNYLPYPANYGFITNTFMDPKFGGDGDALDVLVISETITKGTHININPIGILKLLDKGEEDHKIIAIPLNNQLDRFSNGIPESVKKIISSWFCNYKGDNVVKFIEWGNSSDAITEIKKWEIKSEY